MILPPARFGPFCGAITTGFHFRLTRGSAGFTGGSAGSGEAGLGAGVVCVGVLGGVVDWVSVVLTVEVVFAEVVPVVLVGSAAWLASVRELPVGSEVVSAARLYATTPVLAVCEVATIVEFLRASYCSRLISGYAVTPLKLALSASGDFGSNARTPAIAPVIVPTAAASASTRRGVVESSSPMRSLRRLAALRTAPEDREPRRCRALPAFLCDAMPASPPRSEQTTNRTPISL